MSTKRFLLSAVPEPSSTGHQARSLLQNTAFFPSRQVSALLSEWGPALLVCFTVVIRLFYQNTRMNDLNSPISDLNTRMDDIKKSLDTRMDDLKRSVDTQIDDLKLFIGAEFKRVDERIDLMNRLVR